MSGRFAFLTVIVGLSLVACGRAATTPVASSTPTRFEPSVTATFTAVSTLGETSTPWPTVDFIDPTEPLGGCPPPPSDVRVPALDDPLNAGDALVQYLNAGGSIERLVEHAYALGVLGDLGAPQGFARPDLNGDGTPEFAISLVEWFEPESPGKVYVAMCEGGAYRIGYASPEDISYPTAQIESAFDMTGDGLDDLLIVRQGCGAHTCFSRVEVVVWYQNALQNRMDDAYFDLPSTGIEVLGPVTDGSYQIYTTGNGVASIGAGPYHRRAVTWGWNQEAKIFGVVEFRFLPSTYRIHFVHDGDRSYALGDYPLALETYNRVIHDITLQDWPSAESAPTLAEGRPQELAAYARFRRILTRLKMDDFASAEVHYQDLIDKHPPGEPGDGFARMGQIFWEEFTASEDFDAACAAAQHFAVVSRAEVIDPLEYGYSNLLYTPEGLCPTSR